MQGSRDGRVAPTATYLTETYCLLYAYSRQEIRSAMFLTVDANDQRPIYQQIVDGVKALIARGDLREGGYSCLQPHVQY